MSAKGLMAIMKEAVNKPKQQPPHFHVCIIGLFESLMNHQNIVRNPTKPIDRKGNILVD
jgi:hypothetical protein